MNPRAPRRDASFHFNAIVVRSWDKLVQLFLHAMECFTERGMTEPLQEFTQKQLAEPWVERGLTSTVRLESYEASAEWPEECARFLTVDVQAEGVFWAVVRAWSKSGESRRLWFGKLIGWAEVRALQEKWKVKDYMTLVDSGYEAKGVYAQCVRFGWIATKGTDQAHFAHFIARGGKRVSIQRSYSPLQRGDPEKGGLNQQRRFASLHLFSNPTLKDRLKQFRDGKLGKWLLPAGGTDSAAEEEYLRQMGGEFKKRVVMPATGRVEWRWIRKGDNHLFDCEVLQVLAATMCGICRDGDDLTVEKKEGEES
jgi:hypothetical protein